VGIWGHVLNLKADILDAIREESVSLFSLLEPKIAKRIF
jgi:hypothetical protein